MSKQYTPFKISIHALRGEGDPTIIRDVIYNVFQSTPSVGRATIAGILAGAADTFQSTPSVGRATTSLRSYHGKAAFQSTPSVGRATQKIRLVISAYRHFNPRPPWGGRHCTVCKQHKEARHFNPRPPWGGRLLCCLSSFARTIISIHALRGEGDIYWVLTNCNGMDISIHALRGEGDVITEIVDYLNENFNPRPPWGGRRTPRLIPSTSPTISIHALRGEGDPRGRARPAPPQNFNPRPPWGGRHTSERASSRIRHFNPRPPWGGRHGHRRNF